ncbi:hypothetical protein JXJ21_07055 [candidate division KSB1 bacterium]|nr:hypothetical protein [candidate division KSB1 bacterium]
MYRHLGKATILTATFILLVSYGFSQDSRFTIKLKTQSLVIGSKITLGDIAQVQVKDKADQSRLCTVILSDSPPPGEAKELSMNFILRKVKEAGYKPDAIIFTGPKIVRITAAQVDVYKIIIYEDVT